MDDDQENRPLPHPEAAVIPPPDLSRRPPGPPSPLESMPKPAPPPPMPADAPYVAPIPNLADEVAAAGSIAPFNTRAIAAIIDLVLTFGLTIGLALILPHFAGRLAYLVGAAYFLTRDALPFLGGQSVGKKAMSLRAVTLDGRPLTGVWEPALIRNAVLFIPFFALVELFLLLTREDKPERGRRLGDEWAKTKVIVEPKPEPPDPVL
jgi:uncharacterized RDD family membrane protein YckC